jgi:hypothetical protein
MSRRASLPGADELFRRTSGEPESTETGTAPTAVVPVAGVAVLEEPEAEPLVDPASEAVSRRPAPRRRTRGGADRRPTGRERHEEKITVYVSPEELVDLEQAKLVLRAQHGLGVDRGRIVREAIAVVIADLEAKGEDSILVRRLRGV